ncbi:MAG: hypothetical protein QOF14_5794 [Hyphomicrobiales bacterium]|nr:hypothetical protein [Hyphomicrobiales bacterium]
MRQERLYLRWRNSDCGGGACHSLAFNADALCQDGMCDYLLCNARRAHGKYVRYTEGALQFQGRDCAQPVAREQKLYRFEVSQRLFDLTQKRANDIGTVVICQRSATAERNADNSAVVRRRFNFKLAPGGKGYNIDGPTPANQIRANVSNILRLAAGEFIPVSAQRIGIQRENSDPHRLIIPSYRSTEHQTRAVFNFALLFWRVDGGGVN